LLVHFQDWQLIWCVELIMLERSLPEFRGRSRADWEEEERAKRRRRGRGREEEHLGIGMEPI
jgi:hypothetical protein